MVVARSGHAQAQQVLILIDGLDDRHQEQQELRVLIGRFTGGQQVDAGVGGHGPVVVLTAPVDAREGFFMEQADQAVLSGHLLHDLHGELVVVRGHVGGGVDGGQLMLGGGHLVVLGLGEDAQLPQLFVQVLHVCLDPGLDGAEIVVVQLLALGRLRAEQGAASVDQILV